MRFPKMPGTGQIRVLIADDEPLARRGIRQLLAPHDDLVVAGESRNGLETLQALERLHPDLLFLDVQMPEMNGFEVLRKWGARPIPPVIFVTAHDQFAVRAFETHALDYLVKPLVVARFDAALARVRQQLQLAAAAEQASRLAALLEEERSQRETHDIDRLLVSSGRSELIVQMREIDWIEADDYYSRLHVGGHSYLLRESLNALEGRLDPHCFARVHRSAIIRLDRVRLLESTPGGDEVVLRNGSRIPVSRRRRAKLNALLRS